MNYKLVEKDAFTVVGKKIRVSCKDGENFKTIPAFCDQCSVDGTFETLGKISTDDMGVMGICANFNHEENSLDYYSAATYTGGEIHAGMETLSIPKFTWMVFEAVGPIPEAIQDVWKRIFSEWFPTSEYEHAGGPEIEVYEKGDMSQPDYKSYVWIPVVKKAHTV